MYRRQSHIYSTPITGASEQFLSTTSIFLSIIISFGTYYKHLSLQGKLNTYARRRWH